MEPAWDNEMTESWRKAFLAELCQAPPGLTEVRRDGHDHHAIGQVIGAEFHRRLMGADGKRKKKFIRRMEEFAYACWSTCEALHLLMLDDEQERVETLFT